MVQATDKNPNKPGFLKQMKREISKSAFFFTAGAITSALAIYNRRRKKKLHEKYKKQIKALKSNKDN